MVSDAEYKAVTDFLYKEARLADEARYAEWEALWEDDAVYWVPATTSPEADPARHLSHIYDNRTRIATRVKLLQSGYRYSQEPASLMRRLISNIEVEKTSTGEFIAGANFLLDQVFQFRAEADIHRYGYFTPDYTQSRETGHGSKFAAPSPTTVRRGRAEENPGVAFRRSCE